MADPAILVTLRPLGLPSQRHAILRPRGLFASFPIGDLALIAAVDPPEVEGPPPPEPRFESALRRLERPTLADAEFSSYVGGGSPIFASDGLPPHLRLPDGTNSYEVSGFVDRLDPTLRQSAGTRIEAAVPESGFRPSAAIRLLRPEFVDLPFVISRLSQEDRFLEASRLEFPVPPVALVEEATPPAAELEVDLLAAPARRIRSAGARMVCSAPPRPAPGLVAQPAILDLEVTMFQPAWRRGVPLPIPGFKPEPKVGKRSCLEASPWFVPGRPKPPMLTLEPLPTPAGWRSSKRQLFAPPPLAIQAPPETKPNQSVPAEDSTKEITSLAKALEAAEPPRRDTESPWPKRRFIPVLTPLGDWWLTCSNQVRVMVIALPLLIAIAVKPLTHGAGGPPTMEERPTAPVRSAHTESPRQGLPTDIPDMPRDFEAKFEKATRSQVDGFKRAVISRAAVEMADDFQNGLDNWDGNGQLGPSWSYDRTGFIRPRALGIYRPSTGLADYAFEFLGKIDQRAVSWVFRASDLNNYYAMKLVDKTGGVTPQMALVHYAVIEGREGPKKEVPLPLAVYKDTLFRIRMDVQGPHFSVQVQGTVVDYWKDGRLKSGGVGFFASRGEESRVRWVQVTHQDDMLGKLCAFLAPYAN